MCQEIERLGEKGRQMHGELGISSDDIDRQERREPTRKFRYNDQYLRIVTNDWSKYLDKEDGKEKKIIARFSVGMKGMPIDSRWIKRGECVRYVERRR